MSTCNHPVVVFQFEGSRLLTEGQLSVNARITNDRLPALFKYYNKEVIDADLENNWIVVSEAIQTILRREGFANPYETLKELTRTNEKITKDSIADFISNLDVSGEVKKELLTITPFDYTGI